jgi:hypothetical protein
MIMNLKIQMGVHDVETWQPISKHKKKSCPFSLPKFIRFLVKWDKID